LGHRSATAYRYRFSRGDRLSNQAVDCAQPDSPGGGQGISPVPVLADAGYGNETRFREEITELGLPYAVGIQGTTTVWPPVKRPGRNSGGTEEEARQHGCRGRPISGP